MTHTLTLGVMASFPTLDELAAVIDWPVAGLLIRLLVLGALAALLSRATSLGLRLAWASGIDHSRRLVYALPLLRLVLALTVVLLAVEPLYRDSPANAAALGLVLLVITATWGLRELQNVMAGLTLAVTRPVRLGDEVHCGPYRGVVTRIGLTRITLRDASGANVRVPASLVTHTGALTAADGMALPVNFDVRVPQRAADDDLTALRDQVLLSTWVDVDAPVLLTRLDDGRVRIQATPVHADEGPDLESDVRRRARTLAPLRSGP